MSVTLSSTDRVDRQEVAYRELCHANASCTSVKMFGFEGLVAAQKDFLLPRTKFSNLLASTLGSCHAGQKLGLKLGLLMPKEHLNLVEK